MRLLARLHVQHLVVEIGTLRMTVLVLIVVELLVKGILKHVLDMVCLDLHVGLFHEFLDVN